MEGKREEFEALSANRSNSATMMDISGYELDEMDEDLDIEPGERSWDYYLADGIYGNLNGMIYDSSMPSALPFRVYRRDSDATNDTTTTPYSTRACFFGPVRSLSIK